MNNKQLLVVGLVALSLVGCKCNRKADQGDPEVLQQVGVAEPDDPPLTYSEATPTEGASVSAVAAVTKCINGQTVELSVVDGTIQVEPKLDEYKNPITCY